MNSQESKLLYASSVVTKYEALLVFLTEEKLHAETMARSALKRPSRECWESRVKFIEQIEKRIEVYRG